MLEMQADCLAMCLCVSCALVLIMNLRCTETSPPTSPSVTVLRFFLPNCLVRWGALESCHEHLKIASDFASPNQFSVRVDFPPVWLVTAG